VMFSNPTLAETYSRVLREAAGPGGREVEIEQARRVWAQGFVAEAIDKICRAEVMDVSGRPHRGRLNGADVAVWSATIEKPIGYDSGRCRALKPGPWCQGLAALQQLALPKGLPFDGLDPAGPDFIHWQVEAAKLVFADRDTFYGDPDFAAAPTDILLGADRADSIARPAPWRHSRLRNGAGGAHSGGGPRGRRFKRLGRTDRWKPRPISRRHGSFRHRRQPGKHDRRDPFRGLAAVVADNSGAWLLPRHSRADVCARGGPPGEPRSRQAPALEAVADNGPARWRALSRLGNARRQQDQWMPEFFLRHVHAGLNLQESIDAPAWRTEALSVFILAAGARPGVLVVESRVPESTVAELRRRGHIVEAGPAWSEGRLVAAARDRDRLKAAANPRGMQAYAAGR
jgi:gamma-glutamyltranspeptidase/glutathione hydrolase